MKVNKQILMKVDLVRIFLTLPRSSVQPYLNIIYKSFILNLNLIDPADPRMHPLLGAICMLRGDRGRQTVAEQPLGRTTRMPEVKLVSSGE